MANRHFLFILFQISLLFSLAINASAQWNEKDLKPFPLDNLSGFRSQAGNWSLSSAASGLMSVNFSMETKPGSGIISNKPDAEKKDNLVSNQDFGSLDIQFDFMMPKGSNSGIFLMGRYEIQLYDSWGKQKPTFADCGGINQRWRSENGKGKEGFEGVAPLRNACRAPGLWQTMKISFEAPQFDNAGKKIANARFASIWLNGVQIHSNIELSGPTKGAIFSGESDKGPFVLQGDHGPVAFRNIALAEFGAPLPELKNLQFEVFHGPFLRTDAFLKSPMKLSGTATQIDRAHAETEDEFLIRYKGILDVKSSGIYKFILEFTGKAILRLDDSLLIDSSNGGFWYQKERAEMRLTSGYHPIEVIYFKTNPKSRSSLGLWYSGPGIKLNRFHAEASLNAYLPGGEFTLPLENETYVQRSFFNHSGNRIPYGINVCSPKGIHYSLNLRSGRLLRAWRSDRFGEVSGMWVDRGGTQDFIPAGSASEFTETAFAGPVSETGLAYPDSLGPLEGFKFSGYELSKGKEPVFHYKLPWKNAEASMVLLPGKNGIQVEIQVSKLEEDIWHAAAEGQSIEATADGAYRINGAWYIFPEGSGMIVRTEKKPNGNSVLLFRISRKENDAKISYSVFW